MYIVHYTMNTRVYNGMMVIFHIIVSQMYIVNSKGSIPTIMCIVDICIHNKSNKSNNPIGLLDLLMNTLS